MLATLNYEINNDTDYTISTHTDNWLLQHQIQPLLLPSHLSAATATCRQKPWEECLQACMSLHSIDAPINGVKTGEFMSSVV